MKGACLKKNPHVNHFQRKIVCLVELILSNISEMATYLDSGDLEQMWQIYELWGI